MKKMELKLFVCAMAVLFSFSMFSCREGEYFLDEDALLITDGGNGTGTTTWTNDQSYLIQGKVFVNDGQVLTIEPGTVIRARTGQGNASSALIVARGGKIIAEGTFDNPIIFTAEGDDLQGSVQYLTKGLWGGLIILGNAKLNIEGGEAHVEGISIDEPRALYGGEDDEDNSGILRYVSIRHGGTNIGEGNEINGLTLAGVGSGTTIDHIEIVSNADDGIEMFGGTVNCRNILVAFCGDDAFDYDLGYRGKGQFWLAIADPAAGDNLVEADGGVNPIAGKPYSIPLVYNVTFIGRGAEIGDHLISFFDNAGGKFVNSIFIRQGKGVEVEYSPNREDSYGQFKDGQLEIKNNIFWDIADNNANSIFRVIAEPGIDISEEQIEFENYFAIAENRIVDPGIEVEGTKIHVIPQAAIHENMAPYPDSWFHEVNYKGAFGSYNWAAGWTYLSELGLLN